MNHVFTGFGFGPIQSGLFVNEAFRSGRFSRIVIAEIDQQLIDAVRANNGSYHINIAKPDGIETVKIDGVEILNPNVEQDRQKLLDALSQSTEIVTSLPSVKFFDMGQNSAASLIAIGLKNRQTEATIIYTAENNNHAAELLSEKVRRITPPASLNNVQFLNTVIGKMSQTVTDLGRIKDSGLTPIAPGIDRAFLVEEFNKILVTKTNLPHFTVGIEVFIEKENLLPFEEAKLFGHNAIHALLAFLGAYKGYSKMEDLKADKQIMKIARDAFLNESGQALIKKYSNIGDDLFTETGYNHYAQDLLDRITNPYLSDTIERAARDPLRKLSQTDRIFGTMSLALDYGIEPANMAIGALAGIDLLLKNPDEYNLPPNLRSPDLQQLTNAQIENILLWLWQTKPNKKTQPLIDCTLQAKQSLLKLAINR